MSTVTSQPPMADQRFVLHNVSWQQYEDFLRALGERRLRHTYWRGTLEITSPSRYHESIKLLLVYFVATLCRVTRCPRSSLGSTTFKDEGWDHGFEADEGFYIGEESVRHGNDWEEFDADRDPSPDLFVEVDITSSSDKRMEIYRSMKVREVWRYRNGAVTMYALRNRKYREIKRSGLFPFLTGADLPQFVGLQGTMDETELESRFEEWVRGKVE